MRCGYCKKEREAGDVCCPRQARNQGLLHATCSHPPPPMSEDLLAEYEAGKTGDDEPVDLKKITGLDPIK